MSNIIQIKRGSGAPPDNSLAPYELGYNIASKQLYIGEPSNDGTIAQPIGMPVNLPTTTLLKSVDSKIEHQSLQIYCEGLTPGKTYTLCLYTLQKSKGNASRYWRHPKNTRDTDTEIGTFTGYANLAGKVIDGTYDETETHPDTPDWMLRGGVLQTEWQFVAQETTELYTINLNEWIVDLLKPILGTGEWGMIGLGNKKQDKTSRIFQFRLRTEDGLVGNTNSTLALSRVKKPTEGESVTIGFFSIR